MDKKNLKTISNQLCQMKAHAQDHYGNLQMFLFGSVAKGKSHPDSDIDVALVSNQFGKDYWHEQRQLDKLAMRINVDIEVHVFSEEDFANPYDGLADQIKKTGFQI